MKKVVFITARDAEYGFNLAGVTQYISDEENAGALLKKVINQPETGLVILDERLIRSVPGERLEDIEEGWHGILLVLPAPERKGIAREDYAARLIQRAIGYHVRLS